MAQDLDLSSYHIDELREALLSTLATQNVSKKFCSEVEKIIKENKCKDNVSSELNVSSTLKGSFNDSGTLGLLHKFIDENPDKYI